MMSIHLQLQKRFSFSNSCITFVADAATGALTMLFINRLSTQFRKQIKNTKDCNKMDPSLFYGDEKQLTKISDSHRFLPKELYHQMVRNCIICCVDCLIIRQNQAGKKECLLVKRASEPVKGFWWLPGGRMLKGETFFAAAKRKAQQETGLDEVTPIHVLGVWNTFFPTSCWDTETENGTQTINVVVLVELSHCGQVIPELQLDETSNDWKWIGLDPAEAVYFGVDIYIQQALARLHEWNPAYAAG